VVVAVALVVDPRSLADWFNHKRISIASRTAP